MVPPRLSVQFGRGLTVPTKLVRLLPRTVATCLFCLLFFAFSSGSAFGFSPFRSLAEVRLHPDTLEMTVGMDLESAWLAMGESLESAPNVEGSMPRVRKYAAEVYRLSTGGRVLAPSETDVDFRGAEGGVVFRLVFARPAAGPLRFDAPYLARLPSYHEADLVVRNEMNKLLRGETLTAAKPWVVLQLPSPAPASVPSRPTVSFWGFLKLGIKQMLTGYDHILFLCALLLVCRSFSSMIPIILCFTLAHSLTLALSALNVVTVSNRVAGPLIAVSVALVGLDNLMRRGRPSGRWLLALAFGLIHGFGFANVLRVAGPSAGGTSMIRPLLSFNLGVELGQFAVLVILLLVLWRLRPRPAFVRYWVPAISAVVLLLGVFWVLQRTVLA